MSLQTKTTHYPYINSNPDITGGISIIEGTRISVRTIAEYYQMGMDVDEILSTLTHLSPAQVHSALAYYFDNQEEIDVEILENSDEEKWRNLAGKHPREGK